MGGKVMIIVEKRNQLNNFDELLLHSEAHKSKEIVVHVRFGIAAL